MPLIDADLTRKNNVISTLIRRGVLSASIDRKNVLIADLNQTVFISNGSNISLRDSDLISFNSNRVLNSEFILIDSELLSSSSGRIVNNQISINDNDSVSFISNKIINNEITITDSDNVLFSSGNVINSEITYIDIDSIIFDSEIITPPVGFTDRVLIDFNEAYIVTGEPETWNTLVSGAISLVDIDDVSTAITLTPSGAFGSNQSGTTSSTIYPVNATRDTRFLNNATGNFTLSGLDNSKLHQLTFYASRVGVSDVRTCDYTCVGATTVVAKVDAANNVDTIDTVTLYPDASGDIVITMTRSSDSTSVFTYIGVLDMEY